MHPFSLLKTLFHPWLLESEGWSAARRPDEATLETPGRAVPRAFTETAFASPSEMAEGVDGKGPQSKPIPDKTEKIIGFTYVV